MDQITFHHDTVLSDVHLLLPNTRHLMTRLNAVGQPVFVSKFKILSDGERRDEERQQTEEHKERREDTTDSERRDGGGDGGAGGDGGHGGAGGDGGGAVETLLDEDGDLDVTHRPRRESSKTIRELVCAVILKHSDSVFHEEDEDDEDECLKDFVKIEHTMATPLEDVGKQVWRGAFLLADFILSDPLLFTGSTVLDLGAGTGLTSIVMATTAKTVYCTDVGDDLLSMCERNVTLNRHLVEPTGGEVRVRRLDWLQTDLCTDGEEEFSWTEDEVSHLYDDTRFIMAADVCYDDDLTDGLFRTLYRLCSTFNHPCTIFISMEKRLNFTLRHMDVSPDMFGRCTVVGGVCGAWRSCLESADCDDITVTSSVMDQITFHHDTVLSDVHLLLPNTRHLMTRLNAGAGGDGGDGGAGGDGGDGGGAVETLLDEDGDLDVTHRPRRESSKTIRELVCAVILKHSDSVFHEEDEDDEDECLKDFVKIEHTMATPLEDVGKQVWRGAFLLADFILSDPLLFTGSTVLDLGAGTGLTSIVMATTAKTVYCTDVGDDLLSMCERNVTLNRHLVEPTGGEVRVRRLDWLQTDLCTDGEEEFSWTEDEVSHLYDDTRFIMAADVCYDDDLTDGLFRTLYRLCSTFNHPCTIFISMEKRLNFTLRHMDVSCEAYDHFRRRLSELNDLQDGRCSFTVTQLQTDFNQFLIYERIQQLELWKVTSSPLHHQTNSEADWPQAETSCVE
ncbi:LOW QUALITY PROTEIN: methyltransferase-like protein 22 [Tautogolabrus adspersus]